MCAWLLLLVTLVDAQGRPALDASDPLVFFQTVADKLLRATFPFGVTNIPVCSNGVYVYTPAVQRLLQFSANLYDANNTNFFPVVFRPLFAKDAANNIFVTGYLQVTNISGTSDLQLSPPYEVTQLSAFATTPIADANGPVNVYGVPWIIGAKKNLPGFEQFYLLNQAQVTRKMQVSRTSVNVATATYSTNQMYVVGISNNLGISFWNSYSNPYPRPLTVYASDTILLALANGDNSLQRQMSFTYSATIPNWPGSQWNSAVPNPLPSSASFLILNWTTNFLPESVYRFSTASWDPVGSPTSSQFETTTPPLPPLPQFSFNTTNYLQAFILDGSNVIDCVQLRGPTGSAVLNEGLADPDYPNTNSPGSHYQWSTNVTSFGPLIPSGVANQLEVSHNPSDAPVVGGRWSTTPTPMGVSTPQTEALYFDGFYQPSFQYNGQNYVNTLMTMQVPYTPSRIVYSSFLLQANDPLIHYLASDLNSQTGETAVWNYNLKKQNGFVYHSDDPSTQPMPLAPPNSIGGRYQSWLRSGQMNYLANIIAVTNNYGVKDPQIRIPDNWNFPTNLLSTLTSLGQVHRGTPWQTFYLKDVDITKGYIVISNVLYNVGTNTWMQWTGDLDANDAMFMAPVNDWHLAGLLMSWLNTNDPAQLLSVNDSSPADWQNVLNGLVVYSNSAARVFFNTPIMFDTFLMTSNSPEASAIATGIVQTKTNQTVPTFYSIGDILVASALTRNSPFLNLGSSGFGQQQMNYGITDWEYEAIPAQLLPRLRPDSIGALMPTSGGWTVSFSGADGYAYVVQTSTNFVDWRAVSTNSPVQGSLTVPVNPAAGSPNQFFRSALQP